MASIARRAVLQERLESTAVPLQGAEQRLVSLRGAAVGDRWSALAAAGHLEADPVRAAQGVLLPAQQGDAAEVYDKNIENFVGTVQVPVGLAGPVLMRGRFATGNFYVPMATTEAALLASVSRGMRCLTEAGGCEALYDDEGTIRMPVFEFAALHDVGRFQDWAVRQKPAFEAAAAKVSRNARLLDVQLLSEGRCVHLRLDFATGDAAGQNMVTFCADAIVQYILEASPVMITAQALESGGSSDKKASYMALGSVRGRKVVAMCNIPRKVVADVLHTTPEAMVKHRSRSMAAHALIGAVGSSSHAANSLAALYLATGQDVACVAEGHACVTRFELAANGQDLLASITLPSILLGTVGGGTALPTQRACLDLLGVPRGKRGTAPALAELAAAACLAGELSIHAAFASNSFAKAHYNLSRHGSQAKM
eukprot:TRINITY_DN3816_c0_g1_i1.p1 TRINITY_DN3816_c0_g1~~TRINITY_DN3816_c0_g1_i1.p1  ORF type:complete len:425 (+),score=91.88 TRINITY_DN3816_c0_g1_i1:85-1359(+)